MHAFWLTGPACIPCLASTDGGFALVSVQFVQMFGVSTSAVASCHAHDLTRGPAALLPQLGSRLALCTLPLGPRLRHTRRRGTDSEHRCGHAYYACHQHRLQSSRRVVLAIAITICSRFLLSMKRTLWNAEAPEDENSQPEKRYRHWLLNSRPRRLPSHHALVAPDSVVIELEPFEANKLDNCVR